MFCRGQVIGLAMVGLGVGIVIGRIVPSCLLLWLLAAIIIAIGIILFQR